MSRSSVSSGQISSRTNSVIQSRCAWNSGSVEKSHAISHSFVASSGDGAYSSADDAEPDRAGRRASARGAGLGDQAVAPGRETVASETTGEVERVGAPPAGEAEAPAQRHVAHAGAAATVG